MPRRVSKHIAPSIRQSNWTPAFAGVRPRLGQTLSGQTLPIPFSLSEVDGQGNPLPLIPNPG